MSADTIHVSTRIDRPYDEVYEYVSDPAHMPEWASGLSGGLEQDREHGDWVGMGGPSGDVRVRFAADNAFGVVDHDVTLADGTVVHVPLRVLRNGQVSEVVITLFRAPKMDDEQMAGDRANMERDLAKLKKVLEAERGGAKKKAAAD